MSTMDEPSLLREVYRVLNGNGDRERKAAGIVRTIRQGGSYRWVGLYEVIEEEIANLAFDGPGAPAHPRFPVTEVPEPARRWRATARCSSARATWISRWTRRPKARAASPAR
jgi:hypothetical protein